MASPNNKQADPPIPLIAEDPSMKRVVVEAERLAEFDTTTVLIEGETGTGKEMIARHIHAHSRRRDRPFVVLDCATIPQTLMDSMLFGYEKGAFTGATSLHVGILEQADSGTLLLDEVATLDQRAQALLLRFMETHEVRRIGDGSPRRLDIRVLAASNRDLMSLVGEGWFRADLYHRIRVAYLHVPSLRNRPTDISVLSRFYLDYWAQIHKRSTPRFNEEVESMFLQHYWPGNVRELRNVMERILTQISSSHIRVGTVMEIVHDLSPDKCSHISKRNGGRLSDPHFIHRFIRIWMNTGGHVTRTAEILHLPKSSVSRYAQAIGLISVTDFPDGRHSH